MSQEEIFREFYFWNNNCQTDKMNIDENSIKENFFSSSPTSQILGITIDDFLQLNIELPLSKNSTMINQESWDLYPPDCSPKKNSDKNCRKTLNRKLLFLPTSARKFKPDGMRKKFKIAVLDFFILVVNETLKNENLLAQDSNQMLKKLSSKVTSRIDIKSIKSMMERTMLDLYSNDFFTKQPLDQERKNCNESILTLITLSRNENLKKLFDFTFKEIIEEFLKSVHHKKHLKTIKNSEKEMYYEIYKLTSLDFVSYYKNNKANKRVSEKNKRTQQKRVCQKI
jgi:hypothetical protein